MWGFPASVPLHGQRLPEQDATTPPKPCDTGQGERSSGAIHGVLQLPSLHFRASEESARGGKAYHPDSAGLRGHGGESQIHGIMSIKSSHRNVCVDTATLCYRQHRLNMLSPHRCLRSWSERLQMRAGLFSEGTQTSPDSMTRCVFCPSVCVHACVDSVTPPPSLFESFFCDLSEFLCPVSLIRAPQRCSVFLNCQQAGAGVENRGAVRKL